VSIDGVRLEVWWSRLTAIVDEAASAMLRTAFSTIIRESNDYTVVLMSSSGARTSSQNESGITSDPATDIGAGAGHTYRRPDENREQSGRPRSQVRAFQARRTALVQVVEGSAPRSGETNRRRARRTHSRRAPVADLARSLPRARPAERRAGGASRKRMPSEQMRLSICSCRESLERSPRSASRRSAPATFASRAVR
jgi:hypothetical protein